MKTIYIFKKIIGALFISLLVSQSIFAQNSISRDSVLAGVKDIISQTTYCGLITVDAAGQLQVRTMNPFPVKDDLVIWFATSRDSKKVKEMKENPKVAVYFAKHSTAIGYVNISGKAEVIDDKELLMKMKRDYWESIPNWQDVFVLIKIVPESLEVINYKYGLNNDPKTSKAPAINF